VGGHSGWQPPTEAARLEWRGFETVQALRVLVAYGRVRMQDEEAHEQA
jgi:hypothetical protein